MVLEDYTPAESFGLWSFRFPPVLVRTGRRLPVQALGERRVLVTVTGYPRGGAPGPDARVGTQVAIQVPTGTVPQKAGLMPGARRPRARPRSPRSC